MWGDERFRRLSPLPPSGQSLWIYLLTCPSTTVIPGLFSAGEAGIAEALHWPVKQFREQFAELLREGLAKADWKARIIWIPKALHYNKPENPNIILGWQNTWDELPECSLKSEAYQYLKQFTEQLGKQFGEAFLNGLGNGMPNQEQEQEQDPEQEQEKEKNPPVSPPKGTRRKTEFPNDFVLTTELEAYARTRGVVHPTQTWEHFKAHHLAKGSTFKHWPQAWRTWVLSPIQKNAPPSGIKSFAKEEGTMRNAAALIRKLEAQEHDHEPKIINP